MDNISLQQTERATRYSDVCDNGNVNSSNFPNVGGNYNNNAGNAGPFYVNFNNNASNTNAVRISCITLHVGYDSGQRRRNPRSHASWQNTT